jgi:hypothetical protein
VQDGGGNLLAYKTSNAQRICVHLRSAAGRDRRRFSDAWRQRESGQPPHIGIIQDRGATAVLQNSAPKSYAAAGAANRRHHERDGHRAAQASGRRSGSIVSDALERYGSNNLRGTLRDDWVFVQMGRAVPRSGPRPRHTAMTIEVLDMPDVTDLLEDFIRCEARLEDCAVTGGVPAAFVLLISIALGAAVPRLHMGRRYACICRRTQDGSRPT